MIQVKEAYNIMLKDLKKKKKSYIQKKLVHDLKFKKFYKRKKIFITGHTGFKGRWLVATLVKTWC